MAGSNLHRVQYKNEIQTQENTGSTGKYRTFLSGDGKMVSDNRLEEAIETVETRFGRQEHWAKMEAPATAGHELPTSIEAKEGQTRTTNGGSGGT